MNISKEEVRHIADLSKLYISDNDIDKIVKDLSSIVDMANMINELDTDNVEVTTHVRENINNFRKDEVKESYSRDEILKNAPSKDAGCISVPKVVD